MALLSNVTLWRCFLSRVQARLYRESIVTLKREAEGRTGQKDTTSAGGAQKLTWPGETMGKSSGSGDLSYIGRLRSLLSLDNLKLHLIAFLQALIALAGN
jgi:hypothetical protein